MNYSNHNFTISIQFFTDNFKFLFYLNNIKKKKHKTVFSLISFQNCHFVKTSFFELDLTKFDIIKCKAPFKSIR